MRLQNRFDLILHIANLPASYGVKAGVRFLKSWPKKNIRRILHSYVRTSNYSDGWKKSNHLGGVFSLVLYQN